MSTRTGGPHSGPEFTAIMDGIKRAPFTDALALVDRCEPTDAMVLLVDLLRSAVANVEVRARPSLKHEGDGQGIVGIAAQNEIAAHRARRGALAELEFEIAPIIARFDLRDEMCKVANTCEIPMFSRIAIAGQRLSFTGWIGSVRVVSSWLGIDNLVRLGRQAAATAIEGNRAGDAIENAGHHVTRLLVQIRAELDAIDARGGLTGAIRRHCRALLEGYQDDYLESGSLHGAIASVAWQSLPLEAYDPQTVSIVLERPGIPTKFMFPISTINGWEIGSVLCDDRAVAISNREWIPANAFSFDDVHLALPVCHRRLSITVRHTLIGQCRVLSAAVLFKIV